MDWRDDYRLIYGKKVRVHPGKVKVYVSEVTRWMMLRDGLRTCLESIPRSDRRMYTVLAEAAAYSDYRMDCERGLSEEKTVGLFDTG